MPYSATYRSTLHRDVSDALNIAADAPDEVKRWGIGVLAGGIMPGQHLGANAWQDADGTLNRLKEVYRTGSMEAMFTEGFRESEKLLKEGNWDELERLGKGSESIWHKIDVPTPERIASLLDEKDRDEFTTLQAKQEQHVRWRGPMDPVFSPDQQRYDELVAEGTKRDRAMRYVEKQRQENAFAMLAAITPDLTPEAMGVIERAVENDYRIADEDEGAFLTEEKGGLPRSQKELVAAYLGYCKPTQGAGAWGQFMQRMGEQAWDVTRHTGEEISDLFNLAMHRSFRRGGYREVLEQRAYLQQINQKNFADLGFWGNSFAEAGGILGYWTPMIANLFLTKGVGSLAGVKAAGAAGSIARGIGMAGRVAGPMVSHGMFVSDFRQQFLQRIALDGGNPTALETQAAAWIGAIAADAVEHIAWGQMVGKTGMAEVQSQAYSKLVHSAAARFGKKMGVEFGKMGLGEAAFHVLAERGITTVFEAVEEALQQAIEEVVVDIGDGRTVRLGNLLEQSYGAFKATLGPMMLTALNPFAMAGRARSAVTMRNLDGDAIDRMMSSGERLKQLAADGRLVRSDEDMGVLGGLMRMTAQAATEEDAQRALLERGFSAGQANTMLRTFAAIRRSAIEHGQTGELGPAMLQADEELARAGFSLSENPDGTTTATRIQSDGQGNKRRQTLKIAWGAFRELDMTSPAEVGSALDYIRQNASEGTKTTLRTLGLDIARPNAEIMADAAAMNALGLYVAENELGNVANSLETGSTKSKEADGTEIDEDTYTITLTEKATRESIWHEVGHAAGYALRRMGLSEEEIDAIQNWRSGEDGKAPSEADMALPEHAGAGGTELYGEERVNYELAGEIARKNEPKTAFARGLEYVGDLVRNVLRIRKKAEEDGNAAAIMTELIWHGHLGKLDTLNDAQKRVLLEARRRRMATDAARETPPPEGPSSAAEGPSSEAEGTKPVKTIRPPDERTVANFCFDRPIRRDDMDRLAASGELSEDDIFETGYRWSPFLRAWVVQPELKGQKFTPNGRYMGLDGEWKGEETRAMVGTFADGTHFVEVDDVPDEIRNETDPDKLRTSVRNLIREKWMNRIIDPNGVRVFVNGATAQEYVEPAKELDDNAFRAKMDAAGKLDEVVSTSTNPQNAPDGRDGHVHKNVKEWEYRDAIFHVNGRYYGTLVNIAVIETVGGRKGNFRKLHDITQIKDITDEVRNLHGDPVGELQSYPSTVGDNANEPPNAPGVNSENQGRPEVGSRRMYAAAQNLPSPEFAMDGTIVDALPAHLREDARAIVAERGGTAAWMVEADGTPTELNEREWLRREAARRHGERRFAIGGVYTGSAADYAQRDENGNIVNGPSLLKIGTGEGASAFGWGLYASTDREEVAESYAQKLAGEEADLLWEGEPIEDFRIKTNADLALAVQTARDFAFESVDDLVSMLEMQAAFYTAGYDFAGAERFRSAADWVKSKKEFLEVKSGIKYIYEQTFFTNRSTPEETERHLLQWYGAASEEQKGWILGQLKKEGCDSTYLAEALAEAKTGREVYDLLAEELVEPEGFIQERTQYGTGAKLGKQSASEFLARAGIDGIVYPTNGGNGSVDVAGILNGKVKEHFNAVSFRDDNIRVDHKWVDGEQRYQIAGALGAGRLENRRLADAEAMERSGATRDDIWRETGWWRGADGKWRVEIADIRLTDDWKEKVKAGCQLRDIMSGPVLDAYDNAIGGVWISVDKSLKGTLTSGVFNLRLGTIRLNPTDIKAKSEFVKTLAHEVQHTIQQQEGFALGTSLSWQMEMRERKVDMSDFPMAWWEYERRNRAFVPALSSFIQSIAGPWLRYVHDATIDEKGRVKFPYETKDEIPRINGRMIRSIGDIAKGVEKKLNKWKPFEIGGLARNGDLADVLRRTGADELGWFLSDALKASFDEEYTKWAAEAQASYAAMAAEAAAWIEEADAVVKEISRPLDEAYNDAQKAYNTAGGEIEARMVEARLGLSDEQRMEIPPWVTEEVVSKDTIATRADYSYEAQRATMERMANGTAPAGEQKQAGTAYPDAGGEIGDRRFAVGAKRRADYKALLEKKRPDMDAGKVLAELDKYGNPKKEKVALHWVVTGAIRLPEDEYKVDEALSVAEKAKVDPFGYASPMELIEAHKEFKPTAKAIDPDTVPELSDRREMGYGIVTYLVQDTREGQAAMRRIIDTHWGEDANPWCLLARQEERRDSRRRTPEYENWLGHRDPAWRSFYRPEWKEERDSKEYQQETGKSPYLPFTEEEALADAWYYWRHYSALPKRVAFRDGKLLAFMATSAKANGFRVAINGKESSPYGYQAFVQEQFGNREVRPGVGYDDVINWCIGQYQRRGKGFASVHVGDLVRRERSELKNKARIWTTGDAPVELTDAEIDGIATSLDEAGVRIVQDIEETWWDRKDESHPDLEWARDERDNRDGRDGGERRYAVGTREDAARMFPNTKFVDADGKPRKAFHGSGRRGIRNFIASREGSLGPGVYFSMNGEYGTDYGAYLNLENPLHIRDVEDLSGMAKAAGVTTGWARNHFEELPERIRAAGYDGIVCDQASEEGAPAEIVVFDPDRVLVAEDSPGLSRPAVGGRIREFDREAPYSPRGQLAALATMYLIQGKEPDRGNLQQIKERLGEQGDLDAIIAEAKATHGRILEDLKAKGRKASPGEIAREAARRTKAAHPEDLLEEAYKRGAAAGTWAQGARGAVLSTLIDESRSDSYHDFALEMGLDIAGIYHRFTLQQARKEAAAGHGKGAEAEEEGVDQALENAVGFAEGAQGPLDPNSEAGRALSELETRQQENIERVLREADMDWEERNRLREERRQRRLEREREAEAAGEGSVEGEGGGGEAVEDVPEGMDENDLAVDILERNRVDIRDPWKFALFLRKAIRNRILKANGLPVDFATLDEALAAEERLWQNPTNVAQFAKSMAAILRDMAGRLMDHEGDTYPAVLVKLEQLSRMQNVRAIEIQAAFEIATIARRSIRETTGKMVEQTRTRLQKSYIGTHRFGEHDELEEDLKRKITGHVRRMAIWYKRVLGLTEGGIEREREKLLDRLSERNRALDEAAAQGVSAAKADEDAVAAETLWKLKALDTYGGTRYLLPGEARERLMEMERWMATEGLKQAARIEEASRRYEKDRETIIKGCAVRDPATGEERTHEEDSKLDRFWRMTVNTINQRFRLLFARAAGQEGAAARELAERDSLRISQGTTRYEREKQEMRRALRDTVREVVGPRGVRAWVKHLQEEIPEEYSRALSKQGYWHLTYGQVMHLYGYLRQTATYGDNISRHGRVGQRVYIERNVLTAEDIKILNGMMCIYAERREALDAASRDITGFEMKSPDPWYMPVKIKTPTRSGLETVVSTVDAMPAVFSERRKHQLDVDEKADIMVMFNDRMEQSARVLGLGRTGLDVIHTWGSADVKDAITKARGKKFTTALVNHLTDWMNGGRPRLQNRAGEDERFLNGLRTVGTYTALWGNVLSGLKQTLSSPVFALAREVGERSIFQDMREFRSDAWKQAWRELAESDPYKARYGDVGVMEETKEAVQGGNMTGRLEAVLRAGMKPIELGDKTPGVIVGVGMYMAARDRMVDSGMDPVEAKRKAADLTMQAVEWTQQSGRTENQPEYARRGSSTTRLMMMFASSPMLQAGWEVQRIVEYREKREAFGKDSKEARDAATALRNAIIINHVVMPLAFQIASWGFQALLGRPPEEEDLPELLYACAIGPYSRLLVLSGLAHAAWNAAMGRSTYGRWNTVPSALVNLEQDVIDAVRLPIDLATWKPEEAWKDIDRFLRRNIAIYRHGRTAWHNWAEAE